MDTAAACPHCRVDLNFHDPGNCDKIRRAQSAANLESQPQVNLNSPDKHHEKVTTPLNDARSEPRPQQAQESRPVPEVPNDEAKDADRINCPPPIPVPTAEQVPDELRRLTRWVCWNYKWDDDKKDWIKPPYSPRSGPEEWQKNLVSFDEARSVALRSRHGIGFKPETTDNFVFLDFDNCLCDGVLDTAVANWLRFFPDTYHEVTPSGTGVRVIIKAGLTKDVSKAYPVPGTTGTATVEIYSRKNYLTVTGQHWDKCQLTIGIYPHKLDQFLSALKANSTTTTSDDDDRPRTVVWTRNTYAKLKADFRAMTRPEDSQNEQLNKCAYYAARAYLAKVLNETEQQLKDELRSIARSTPYCPGIESTLESGWNAGIAKGKFAIVGGRTDAANAERFVASNANRARYCGPEKQWYVWDGRRWAPSLRGEAGRLALETARSIYAEAATIENDDERKALGAWAMKSENAPQIMNMLKLAAMFKEVAIVPADLDADPWLLTVENGTLDLRNGQLRVHRCEDLISKMVPIRYEPRATCPVWERHLELVLPDEKTRAFFQRASGYSLTGLDVEEVFFFLQGEGQNGKTKTLEVLAALLGDYAWTATFGAFVRTHNSVPLNVIADLKGRRFVVVDEGEENQTFNESLLKNVTGGSNVAGRQLYSRTINYRPTFKLWFGSNYKPSIQGIDLAIWRRVRLIPFNVTIPEDKRDKFFVQKLMAELSGILNWTLAGLAEWQRIGLAPSDDVRNATRAYRSEMDTVKEFIEEQCDKRPKATVKLTDLYSCFFSWSKRNGNNLPMGRRAFADRLRRLGLDVPDNGTHARIVWGISLRPGVF